MAYDGSEFTPGDLDQSVSEARALLKKTRELIEQGWTQLVFHQRRLHRPPLTRFWEKSVWKDSYCLLGALREGTSTPAAQGRAYAALAAELEHWHPMEWNDWPGRTQAEVLRVIDTALEKL